MGMLGNYIDGLTPEQKDRVIEAQEWTNGELLDLSGRSNARCLIGHAKDMQPGMLCFTTDEEWQALHGNGVGIRFDRACGRFGKERVIQAAKKRAAKPQFILPAVSRRTILQSSL